MQEYIRKICCRLCNSKNITTVLKLEDSALCDSYSKKKVDSKKYPLELQLCNVCKFTQLSVFVDKKTVYDDYIYLTTSSTTLKKHFEQYVNDVAKFLALTKGRTIIDIGSNDGTLLKYFKRKNHLVLGIEPSNNIAKIANDHGIKTINKYFDLKLSKELKKQSIKADVITVNNVFANIDNLNDVILAVRELLNENGVLIIESSYLLKMVSNMVFDFIYHEHLSYLSVLPLVDFFKEYQMRIMNIENVDTKGGSLRYYIVNENSKWEVSDSVSKFMKFENNTSVDFEYFNAFESKINLIKTEIQNYLDKFRNKKIVGFGASATSTTLITHFSLHKYIDYLVDDNPRKVGTYSPGYNLPVYSPDKLNNDNPEIIIILAWRYTKEILSKIINVKAKIIVPLPNVKIYNL